MTSYHDKIQSIARAIEQARAARYSLDPKKTIVWSETQTEYLYAAIYKLLRVKNHTKDVIKALDDILDAYNYCGLLFDDIVKGKTVTWAEEKISITEGESKA